MVSRFSNEMNNVLSALRGGSGYDLCSSLTGPQFERGGPFIPTDSEVCSELCLVFYKNQIAMSTTYLNLYMVFGGTNWGKLPTRVEFLHQLFLISFAGGIAHPGVYTSYDYVSLELPFLL